MIALQEVTVWEDSISCNHTYLMDGESAVAYIKQGDTEPFYFKNPLRIDKRGRKFVTLKVNPFKAKVVSSLIEVIGSKGDKYYVDPDAKTCTCSGFTYRGTCKHLTKVL
jgi:hypothetical protein